MIWLVNLGIKLYVNKLMECSSFEDTIKIIKKNGMLIVDDTRGKITLVESISDANDLIPIVGKLYGRDYQK